MIEREKLVRQKENVSERRTLQTKKKEACKEKERKISIWIYHNEKCMCVCMWIYNRPIQIGSRWRTRKILRLIVFFSRRTQRETGAGIEGEYLVEKNSLPKKSSVN